MLNHFRKADPVAAAIIALGVLIRVWLFVSGRHPLDGDEAVMGMMGADVARLVRLPIYFYGQHYMGTLEVPLIAFLQRLGTESWMFSAWPLRLTGWTYFALLGVTHFLLCRRFFGRATALWCLFFLCVGPHFWTEYSVRLRHVPLMMVMAEAIALAMLALRDRWMEKGIWPLAGWFGMGAMAGLAWWHYQLVIVFIPALVLIFIYPPSPIPAMLSRLPDESRGRHAARLAGLAMMGLALGTLAVLTLGKGSTWIWNHREWFYYPHLVAAILVVFGTGWAASGAWKKSVPSSRVLAMAMAGFLVASLPTLWFLATMQNEFWVPGYRLDISRIPDRLRDLALLELAGLLEIIRYGQDLPSEVGIGLWSYVALMAYGSALVVFLNSLFRPGSSGRGFGLCFFLVLGLTIIFVSVIAPRSTTLEKPRFLLPIMIPATVALGLLADTIMRAVAPGEAGAGKKRRRTAAAILAIGSMVLWGSNWVRMVPAKMSWPSGFEEENLEIIRTLKSHGVHRVVLQYHTDYMLLGHNLQFASRMRIRFNENALTDRFIGLLDSADFPGPLHGMIQHRTMDEIGRRVKGSFRAGPFLVYPLASINRVTLDDPMFQQNPPPDPQEPPHAND